MRLRRQRSLPVELLLMIAPLSRWGMMSVLRGLQRIPIADGYVVSIGPKLVTTLRTYNFRTAATLTRVKAMDLTLVTAARKILFLKLREISSSPK